MSEVDKLVIHSCLLSRGRYSNYYFSPAYNDLRKTLKQARQYHQNQWMKRAWPRSIHRKKAELKINFAKEVVTHVIKWLIYVWQGGLCTLQIDADNVDYDFNKIGSEFHFDSDSTIDLIHFERHSQVCSCENDVCKTSDCHPRCKYVCWQRFSINRWECETYTDDFSVPLDLICDGKYDCFDKTDETSCTTGMQHIIEIRKITNLKRYMMTLLLCY